MGDLGRYSIFGNFTEEGLGIHGIRLRFFIPMNMTDYGPPNDINLDFGLFDVLFTVIIANWIASIFPTKPLWRLCLVTLLCFCLGVVVHYLMGISTPLNRLIGAVGEKTVLWFLVIMVLYYTGLVEKLIFHDVIPT